jgi:hypothetical protein
MKRDTWGLLNVRICQDLRAESRILFGGGGVKTPWGCAHRLDHRGTAHYRQTAVFYEYT